ncbi:hypothetical protein HMF8227_00370 [Saliniradius amylolyticus]|uniref:Solute-binding protein family 3/N-terminal domain-containing protein n=1 Tax=Saliniradius amylolyticus TaxID=2183582 RepID=A0A2S2DZS2_9ALTE|nr:transporter substrate-binding domain-containing protein [Saliniradius amylolyticus]AWL10876.1 hypothetical protein HMF8227_00370 [Saliniradius amylolyticus]
MVKKLILLTGLLWGIQISNAETLSLVADKWCPYNCAPTEQHPGFMIEIAQRVFAKHDIAVNYYLVPWSRALHGVEQGQFDAAVGAARVEAPTLIYPGIEQGWMQNALWTLPERSFNYLGPPSLNDRVLGYTDGYSYGPALDRYIANPNGQARLQAFFGSSPLADAVKMLQAGRIDVLVEDANVLGFFLKSRQQPPLANVGKVISNAERQQVYIAFSPELPEAEQYARWLAEGTQTLRRSGELADILRHYGLRDWREAQSVSDY